MNTPAHPATRPGTTTVAWVLITAILSLFAWRIQSYVTAQDPSIYIGLARRLLANPPGSAESLSVLFRLAPGYPVLLALSIRLFGDFAPFWLNLGFVVGFFLVLGRLMTRWHGSGPAPALILLVTAVVMLTGYGLNPHFLLYPFRAAPCYALVFLAYLILDGHLERPRSSLHAGTSGLLLLLAALIREPMVFALAGAVGYVVSCRGWGGARRSVFALLLPFLAVLVIGLLFASVTGRWATVQALSAYRDLGTHSAPDALITYAATAWELARQVRQELTWAGIAALGAGLWFDRRRREMWWLLVVPAGLLLAFYACLEPHRRYALSILVFLCPVVGAGVIGLLQRATTLAERRGLKRAGPALYGVSTAACVLVLAGSGWRQQSWGPRVSRADVRAFQASVAEFASPGDVVYSEWACRHLGDVVQSYTGLSATADPRGVDLVWREGRTAYFLQPLNGAAFMSSIQDRYHVHVEGLIRYRADLVPVRGDAGDQRVVSIAGGQFAVFDVQPWSVHTVRRRIDVRRGRPLTVWLNLREAGTLAAGTVRLLDGETSVLAESALVPGNAIQVVVVPADEVEADALILEITADRPIPSEPVHAVRTDRTPVDFDLLYRRSLSVYGWFRAPFLPMTGERKYLAVFQGGGKLCLPPVLGSRARIDALLVLTPGPGHDDSITTTYLHNGQVLRTFENALDEPRFWHGFAVNDVPAGESACLDLRVEPPTNRGPVRIHKIRLVIGPANGKGTS